ncbi:MAG: ATP synthase F1 subunit delta [Lachnospiraceae bacterium]|nr:ATP synthase F1 subunit delta [Lachnospiraceae bacterium]
MAKLVSTTYGEALFELAVEENLTDALYEEAKGVLETFEQNQELTKFLTHPKIESTEKRETIEKIFGQYVSKNMTGFLVLLVEKGHYGDIEATLKYFISQIKEYKKIGIATVSSASELDESQKKKIEAKLLATTAYESFEMHYLVDPHLIGGLVIRIGDRVVDSSIRNKLSEITKELRKIQLNA